MACKNIVTLLGYQDEPVTEKNKTLVNFTTNKIGGRPDSPPGNLKVDAPNCPLCQLPRLLVVQVYAPIDSTYHRTLYVFTCINSNCWNQNDSWICLRAQHIDSSAQLNISTSQSATATGTDWCHDADEWDDDDNSHLEENGNVINKSDDDDESASLDESIRMGFEHMGVDDNDNNANGGAGACQDEQGGAVGTLQSPTASAEIEGAEGEVVSIDTPTYPQRDIAAILNDVANLPAELFHQRNAPVQFDSFFMSVYEDHGEANRNPPVDRHVKELLQEYQADNEEVNFVGGGGGGVGGGDGDITMEKYEKSYPAHGDKMFHFFLTKIRQNPGHFLRYSRGFTGLLLCPLQEGLKKCKHCQSDMTYEFQILPTLIPLLRLTGDQSASARLEYGNVLIFTCTKSCWSSDSSTSSVRQECVFVQSETF